MPLSTKVLHSSFLQSATNNEESIPSALTEIAILGRSNVGKSSFINKLLNARLARSSSTPGKTRLINFFQTTWHVRGGVLGEDGEKFSLIFVDFPGFGYAKVAKAQRRDWDRKLTNFLSQRRSIKLCCHLIDSRHRGLELDREIREFLDSTCGKNGAEVVEIYTKSDKLKKNELRELRRGGALSLSTLKTQENDLQKIYSTLLSKGLGLG